MTQYPCALLRVLLLATFCLAGLGTAAADDSVVQTRDESLIETHLKELEDWVQESGKTVPEDLIKHLDLLGLELRRQAPADLESLLERLDALRTAIVETPGSDSAAATSEASVSQGDVLPQRPAAELGTAEPLGLKTAPVNNTCEAALAIDFGVTVVELSNATRTGASSCDTFETAHDLWYRWTPPLDGQVVIYTEDFSSDEAIFSIYRSCPGSALNELACAGEEGLLIDVEAGEELLLRVAGTPHTSSSFAMTLGPPASISGQVVETVGGAPALPTSVGATKEGFGSISRRADVAADGTYTIPVIVPGTHFLTASGDRHRRKYYDDITCTEPDDICFPNGGDPVEVAPGAQVTGIDFVLDVLGEASGTVTDSQTGLPVAFASIRMRHTNGNGSGFATADAEGRFLVEGLQAGEYRVVFSHPEFRDELFGGLPCSLGACTGGCSGGACGGPIGTTVSVDLNARTEGIDGMLEALGRIQGKVTEAATGNPIPFLDITAVTESGFEITRAMTGADGTYEIGGLESEEVWARTRTFRQPYVDELYQEISCPLNRCDLEDGTAISVALQETVEAVDFTLDRTGEIRGKLTQTTDGAPICSGAAVVYDEQGFRVDDDRTDCADGSFVVDDLSPGLYFLKGFGFFHQAVLYDGIPCTEDVPCDILTGTPILVQEGSTTSDIDLALPRLGQIRGRVLDAVTGLPLEDAEVRFWSSDGQFAGSRDTEFDGTYGSIALAPDAYWVSVSSPGYDSVLYPDVPTDCDFGNCDPSLGEPIPVGLNQTVTGIDVALVPSPSTPEGVIEGTVRTELGELTAARLSLYSGDGSFFGSREFTSGNFRWDGLEAGSYFLFVNSNFGIRPETYQDRPCLPEDCEPLDGTPIPVVLGQTTPIDIVVSRRSRIEGTIRDGYWNDPLREVAIDAYDANGEFQRRTGSGADGTYLMEGLEPGTYYLTATREGFLGQRFPDIYCPFNSCGNTAGTAVVVEENGTVSNIDFTLDLQQGIAGTVRDEASGARIPEVVIEVVDQDGNSTFVRGNDQGRYLLGLPLGTYRLKTDLEFNDYRGTDEVYNDLDCLDNETCDISLGEAVSVVENQILDGIDFSLQGAFCVPSFFNLCLDQGRFRAELSFRDVDGSLTRAFARELTDDSGTFYFFDRDNIEVMVKVIDACVAPFDSFWVFTTGLTNLETVLTVTDNFTAEVRTYSNPQETPYELVRDTAAFATCDFENLGQVEGVQQASADVVSKWTSDIAPGKTTGSCEASPTAACLLQSRFRVEATWRDAQGGNGIAQAVQLTPDTGYFWFFAEDNVEVLVKALNACDLNPFNSFWLFAAGLTDVEVSLNVTDTETGEVRTYTNPLNNPFQPIQDTGAFLTCP